MNNDSTSSISNQNGTVIIQPPVIQVAEISSVESATVSTISEQDTNTVIETSRVELISIETPENNTLTLIEQDAQQTLIETKQIEIIEIDNGDCSGKLDNVIAGNNIDIDYTNPLEPVISATNSGIEQVVDKTFKYTNGLLSGVEYSDGSVKILNYLPSGQLDTLLFMKGGIGVLKQFNYDNEDKLISINETQV